MSMLMPIPPTIMSTITAVEIHIIRLSLLASFAALSFTSGLSSFAIDQVLSSQAQSDPRSGMTARHGKAERLV
jgi:hypothetical protein